MDPASAGQGAGGHGAAAARRSDLAEGLRLACAGRRGSHRVAHHGPPAAARACRLMPHPGFCRACSASSSSCSAGCWRCAAGGVAATARLWRAADRAGSRAVGAGARRSASSSASGWWGTACRSGLPQRSSSLPRSFVLQNAERPGRESGACRGGSRLPLVIGLGAGVGVTLVFQDLFLVRLP